MKLLLQLIRRWRRHLNDIDAHLDYPDLMAPPLPRGIDVRGEHEMELHWNYRRKILEQKKILDASRDQEAAGYKIVSLEDDDSEFIAWRML